jgi:hypothetical protein
VLALRKTTPRPAGRNRHGRYRGRGTPANGRATAFPTRTALFFYRPTRLRRQPGNLAAYHAAGLARFGTVADLGCGVGMDALALAKPARARRRRGPDDARHIFAAPCRSA